MLTKLSHSWFIGFAIVLSLGLILLIGQPPVHASARSQHRTQPTAIQIDLVRASAQASDPSDGARLFESACT